MLSKLIKCFRGSKGLLTVCLALVTLLAGIAVGQETTGTISGQVTDASGSAVPNAKVEVTGPSLPRPIVVTSDATGQYQISQIPAGVYVVTGTAQGFSTVRKNSVPVNLGRATRLDFKMEVGQVTESVVVSADAVLVDTNSSSSAVVVDRTFFDTLPKGRGFDSLVALAPGARNEGKTGGYQVDGSSGSENTFYLEGLEVGNIQNGTLDKRNQVPMEMIQQVQVKNGVMEAQYGGAMGGVVNAVLRSGSNDFHGYAGFYFNNSAMQARPRPTLQLDPTTGGDDTYRYFNRSDKQVDQFTTWNPTFNLAGRILKDRLFFFAGFSPTTTNTDRFVVFNDGPTGTYHRKEFNQNAIGKLDAVPFSKLRVNATWIWNPSYGRGSLPAADGTGDFDAPYAPLGNYSPGNVLSGQADYVASSKLILSFRGGYNYSNNNTSYGLPSFTSIYYSGSSTTIPPADLRAPNGYIQNPTTKVLFDVYKRTNLNADASYTFNWGGQHTLKGGWQANLLSNSVNRSDWANGYYRYYWGLSWPCITSQCSGSQTGTYGFYRYRQIGTYGDASSTNHSIFFQDNWRVNKHLSLNLGIRTEREYLPSFSVAGQTTAAPPIEFSWGKKFSPRVGASWDPKGDGKMRVYGSFGYFYDIMKYEMPRGSFGGDVWLEYYYSLDDPNWVKSNSAIPADPRKLPGKLFEVVNWRIPSNDPGAHLIDPDLKPMKQRMMDFGVEYSLNPMLVGAIRYTNRRLIRTIEDTGYIGEDGETYLIANPGYGVTASAANWLSWMGPGIPTTPKAQRDYDAVEFRLDKRFARSYNFTASYTWSRLYGNYSGLASSDENGRTSPNVNRYYDQPWVGIDQSGRYTYGRLATDRPHTFKFFGTYSAKSKLGTTTFAPNVQLYSGVPLTTEVNVVSTTPAFPYGRGDLGRTPVFYNFDVNIMHELTPFKNHEAMKTRFELAIFNLFNSSIVTDREKALLHPNDGQIGFDDYADVFKGFNAAQLMKTQDLRTNPMYGLASSFQAPRSLRLQVSFIF